MESREDEHRTGIYNLNTDPNFNYQLNRTILWNGGNLEDIKSISPNIKDSISWKREMISIGDKAAAEGRTKAAIAYYRMSEFFMYDGDPEKMKYYDLGSKMFYNYYGEYFRNKTVIRYNVPYKGIKLPVMFAGAKGTKRGTLIVHGGNDSYCEEFFAPLLYFAGKGFDVYLFEGPGQGGVLREQGMKFTYKWEEPVKVILDFFNLDDVTIIGVSLGGMLAPRAAAFEKRIKRVVAWSIFPSAMDIFYSKIPPRARPLIRMMLKFKLKGLINYTFKKIVQRGGEMFKWAFNHALYAYGGGTAYGLISIMKNFSVTDVAPLITQDMMILGANKDHFIDYHLINKEIDALTNVKSLTVRIFTDKEGAGDHCNLGNGKLAMDTIVNWVNMMLN